MTTHALATLTIPTMKAAICFLVYQLKEHLVVSFTERADVIRIISASV